MRGQSVENRIIKWCIEEKNILLLTAQRNKTKEIRCLSKSVIEREGGGVAIPGVKTA